LCRVYNVSALAAKRGSAVLHSWQAHRGPVYQLSFATLGGATVLLTCGDDGCVRGWALDWATLQDGTISSQAKVCVRAFVFAYS
jgi:WD40 repeat protein